MSDQPKPTIKLRPATSQDNASSFQETATASIKIDKSLYTAQQSPGVVSAPQTQAPTIRLKPASAAGAAPSSAPTVNMGGSASPSSAPTIRLATESKRNTLQLNTGRRETAQAENSILREPDFNQQRRVIDDDPDTGGMPALIIGVAATIAMAFLCFATYAQHNNLWGTTSSDNGDEWLNVPSFAKFADVKEGQYDK